MDNLLYTINSFPIIDHHAHNLLLPEELQARDFLSITTEAEGPALEHATSALSHLRAVKQLSQVLSCTPTWEAVQASIHEARAQSDEAWAKLCLQGIQTILIDDGLDQRTVHPYDWHDRLVCSPCKRIVRVEAVAEQIMVDIVNKYQQEYGIFLKESPSLHMTAVAKRFFAAFNEAIRAAMADDNVVGFKSVICYRTGLDLSGDPDRFQDSNLVSKAMKRFFSSPRYPRIEDEDLGPYLVHRTAFIISCGSRAKPFQFHTGLGDNDIKLSLASPSHMQTFLERHPTVPIVLLHAAYPFTKEAGYLASVYANCYLDIGEVFPFVSQEGQETVIRESLDLCPSQKLMWSTDGHWYPETYLLAVLQVKEGLTSVLQNMVQKKHIEAEQAIQVVKDLYFNTANRLYDLNLEPVIPTRQPVHEALPMYSEVSADEASSHHVTAPRVVVQAAFPSRAQVQSPPPQYPSSHLEGFELFQQFITSNPNLKYLRLTWLDYTATPRLRILPLRTAISIFEKNKTLAVPQVCLGLLQNDVSAAGFGPAGEYDVLPDFSSLRLCEREGWGTVACEFRLVDENGARTEIDICPRTLLRKKVQQGELLGIKALIGFEIEVVFIPNTSDKSVTSPGHAWSVATSLHPPAILPLLEEICASFERCSIPLIHFHPEAAPGQFEFVLDARDPIEAVDTLLAAKETIASIAARHSLRATCIPKPYPMACGTGAHIHSSVQPEIVFPSFYAGVLKHLKGIAAFSLCNNDSYHRMMDGLWAGGRWVAWGTKNKEGALRKIEGSHWELKWCDGFANFYLVVAAYLAAGFSGVDEGLILDMGDCTVDPAKLDDEGRKRLGITKKLWGSFGEALSGIERGEMMKNLVGERVVEAFVSVKRSEMAQLKEMSDEDRRRFLLERY